MAVHRSADPVVRPRFSPGARNRVSPSRRERFGPEGGGAARVREEAIVWKLVDGVHTVTEITESTFLSDFEVVKAMDQLIGRQLLVAAKPAAAASSSSLPQSVGPKSVAPSHNFPAVVLGISLVGLGIFSRVLPKNPANFLLHATRPGGILAPLENSVSVSRLREWTAESRLYYLSQGSYPASLTQLSAASILENYSLPRGEFGDYRYILRTSDDKYDLYGRPRPGSSIRISR